MASLRQLRSSTRDSSSSPLSFDDYVEWVTSGNTTFPTGYGTVFGAQGKTMRTEIDDNFVSHVQNVYKRNGIVFACMLVRQSIFAEVNFRFQALKDGRPGKLFGNQSLEILERPWPNGTTGELATRMIQDVDLSGNFYAVREGNRLYRRAPHKMHLVLDGDPLQEEFVSVVGYVYQPNGHAGQTYTYTPEQVCHWSPTPDPLAEYRGMSWLTPVVREILSDSAATEHKLKFFANGGTPQVIVTFPPDVMDEASFERFKAKMDRDHAGVRNAHKTLYLAPGADAQVVGSSLEQMSFSDTQGRDECRIAAAAGISPVIIGLKDTLQGSSINSGNHNAARRRLADGTMRPLYRSAAAALEVLAPPPTANGAARLWYDDSQVAFFREDREDAATIQQTKAATIKSLVDAGYVPETVVDAVETEDMTLLEHSGLFSIQLQPPGTGDANNPAPATGA